MGKRYFTPCEANGLLPYIQEDLTLLQEVKREFKKKAAALRELRYRHEQASQEPPEELLFDLEAGMEFLHMEAKTLTDSIRLKGALLKDVDRGLIDFPAMMNGEEVLLCWKQGEERIQFYHGDGQGFCGRRPLPQDRELG